MHVDIVKPMISQAFDRVLKPRFTASRAERLLPMAVDANIRYIWDDSTPIAEVCERAERWGARTTPRGDYGRSRKRWKALTHSRHAGYGRSRLRKGRKVDAPGRTPRGVR